MFVLPDLNINYLIYWGTKQANSRKIDTAKLCQESNPENSDEEGSDKSQVEGGNTRPAAHFLSSEDQYFMCLMKLRTGATTLDLAERFNVSEGTVSSIMLTWIKYLYVVLGSVKIWPHHDILLCSQPEDFKYKYPNCLIIVDATELKIQIPSALQKHSECYSTYKSSTIVKSLIGVDAMGGIIM